MDFSSATIFKAAACGAFGLATALLVVVAHRLTLIELSDASRFAGPSLRRAEMRRRTLARSKLAAWIYPWLRILANGLERLGFEPLRAYVRDPYSRAGYPGGLADDEVVAVGCLLGAGCVLFLGFSCAVFIGGWAMWFGVVGLPLGFLILVSHLKTRAAEREVRILRALPYVLDLLVLMLRSGSALQIALRRVVNDYEDHPIGEELGQLLAEIEMGAGRAEAMRRMAQRLKIPDITSLADSIAQSEELGWPLAQTLERLSDRLTSERILRAQSTAGAAGVWVMLPSTMVLMGAVLLLFGPMIVRMMRGGFALN